MDEHRAARLIGRIRRDTGGAFASGLAYLGDRLGLWPALAERGPCTAAQLAEATGLVERYVLEWLRAMAAFGYVEHDPERGAWWLDDAQRAVLVDETSPWFAGGTFQFTAMSLLHTEELARAFREGGGIAYADLHPEIPESIDRMHRPWFDHLLTGSWLPSIPGLTERLESGIRVLDVGCGLGRSTVAVARAWPRSRVIGVDPHAESIDAARRLAEDERAANAAFEPTTLQDLPADDEFDLVLAIDCIHDMTDPVGALRAVRGHLAPDGLFVWSEPTGSDNPLENQAPLARLRAALSSYHCLTVSLAEGGPGLGTLIGEAGARRLAAEAGFADFSLLPVDSETQLFFGLRA